MNRSGIRAPGGGATAVLLRSWSLDHTRVKLFTLADTQTERTIMKSFSRVIIPVLLVLPALTALECGPCKPDLCTPLPLEGCHMGSVLDYCGCCSVCAAAEGEACGRRHAGGRRCGSGLECIKINKEKKNKLGVCGCKSNYEVCGTDGVTYRNGCGLRSASLAAQEQGIEPITVQNKGRCATAPLIVTPPGEVYNVTGSQVYLSCEAVGVPTPVITWKKVLSVKKLELLPGDRENLAIQTRGGPQKHEVTGWVLISPLTKEEGGSYECHATNAKGEASAVGAIHLVESSDDIIVKKVTKED
eukprot:XP_003979427.2 PREDICTED: insulin-like growth factor-binding protein 7 [Takifugu rubripes]